ncbi:hypothetical protein D3C71_1245890 [compost metagenome]
MTFSRSGFLPRLEITRSTLPVVRNGMRLVLLTGVSSSLTLSWSASSFAVSISRPRGFMSGPTEPNGGKSWGTATLRTPRLTTSSRPSAWAGAWLSIRLANRALMRAL